MRHIPLFCAILMFLLPGTSFCKCKLKVVATTADLADLVKVVGRDRVNVKGLSRGDQDPHSVEPRPSMVMAVKRADLLVRIGMDLDLWAESIIDASGNRKVVIGARGYLDASGGIKKMEVPEGQVDGSMGDIHIYGNPHYWVSPENGKPVLVRITDKLCELCPDDTAFFRKNHAAYVHALDSAMAAWKERLRPFAGEKIVTYHNSWPYFARCFQLDIAGYVEPKPGIPPTPAHVHGLVEKMKSEGVRVIIMEPYFNRKTAGSIAKSAGAKVVLLSPSVGGLPGTETYLKLQETNVNRLARAFTSK